MQTYLSDEKEDREQTCNMCAGSGAGAILKIGENTAACLGEAYVEFQGEGLGPLGALPLVSVEGVEKHKTWCSPL